MRSRHKTYDIFLRKLNICQFDTSEARQVLLNGEKLPLFPENAEKFITIGDSGCNSKLSENEIPMNCGGLAQWKYPKIAESIKDYHPDFVIHLGDISYTRYKNYDKDASHVTSILTEFFIPSQSFLSQTPIIMVRGNHDNCVSGNAWSIFFAPNKYSPDCQETSLSYAITIDKVQFIILDVATTSYGKTAYSQNELENISTKFEDAFNLINQEQVFVCLHIPVLNMSQIFGEHTRYSPVIKDALSKSELWHEKAIYLAGHYHLNGYLKQESTDLFISGSSGFDLDILSDKQLDKVQENFQKDSILYSMHGYNIFSKQENHWIAEFVDIDTSEEFLLKEFINDIDFNNVVAYFINQN